MITIQMIARQLIVQALNEEIIERWGMFDFPGMSTDGEEWDDSVAEDFLLPAFYVN